MAAKLSELRGVLNSPIDHFATLWRYIRPTGGEVISIDADYSFAEIIVPTVDHSRILLFIPLKNLTLNDNPLLASPPSSTLCAYRVLKNELTTTGKPCDVIVQHIPMGDPLHLSPIDAPTALRMINVLEKECRNIGFSHNALSAESIIVGNDDRLYPIRYHNATMDGCKDNFDTLRAQFAAEQIIPGLLSDVQSSYTNNYCDIYNCHHGFMRFCDSGLFGYKNHKGEDIIDAKYLWAGDFCENRAGVETEFGFGVINPRGEFIIKPYLDSLYYDTYNSIFYYYDHDTVCAFDYNGTPLSSNNPKLDHLKQSATKR